MIHVRPAGESQSSVISVRGKSFTALTFPAGSPDTSFFVTFEEAAEALARLPRMFVEPDGSFVWVGDEPAPWQMDGVLYDRNGRLLYVEVKGCGPAVEFDRFLSALGWPGTPVVFQLAREAVFLEESEFRRFASEE